MDGQIRYESLGRTAHITFDRPQARNAMTWAMFEQLAQICTRLQADDDIRVAVLRGEGGKAFIAGTDIGQFADFQTGEDGARYEARMESILSLIEALPQATVAVIEGYAVGGGLTIAAVCDLRLCTPDAKFGLPIARTVGNCLSMENYARLVSVVGPANAKALIFRADFISAQEGCASGLTSEIVEPELLDARVAQLCEQLENQAPLTMWATKESLRRLTKAGLPDGDDIVEAVYGSIDFKEGIAAFMAKRPPLWRNR